MGSPKKRKERIMESNTHETFPVDTLVEGGKPFTEDWDLGRVLNVLNGSTVTVAWQSLVQTEETIGGLEAWDGVYKWAPEEEDE